MYSPSIPRRSARIAAKLGVDLGKVGDVAATVVASPRNPLCYKRTQAGKRCKLPSAFIDGLCVVHSVNRVPGKIFGKDMSMGKRKRCGHICALDEPRCCACLDKRTLNEITYHYPRSAFEPVVVDRSHGYCPCCRKD